MSKPAARLNDLHVCPMQTPAVVPIPHVGGPIVTPGAPTVLIGGVPAATVGSMCICVGPPDVIAPGSLTVLMSGQPAARMGDMTAHGGSIVSGFPTVLIGDSGGGAGGPAAFTMGAARSTGAAFTQKNCASKGAQKGLTGSPFAFVGDPTKKHWVEIELVDQKGKPVPYERYRIVPPNEKPVEGFLDIKGQARLDGIDPGTCVISFPDLDAASWKPESGPPPHPVKPPPVPTLRKPRIDANSAKVRTVGRPRIVADSVKVVIRIKPSGIPTIVVSSTTVVVRLGDEGRPDVQKDTVQVHSFGRPMVDTATIKVQGYGQPSVDKTTIKVQGYGQPSVDKATIKVQGYGQPMVDTTTVKVTKKP